MPHLNKKYFLAFCVLIIAGVASGQTTISGTLISKDETGLSGISILVLSTRNATHFLGYDISDENGKFKLTFTGSTDSVIITVKSLNYKDTLFSLVNCEQQIKIVLQPDVFEIREVHVRANPISVRGDTLNYVVQSFATSGDRSISDVISRLPGFEVNETGQVLYQGKPIQKYYIEGLDLLENRYALANKNLPHQSVSSVEVLQNHQPVKILENRIATDGTSINIKLKNDVAVTGTLFAGTGLSPVLHHINLTPMLFHKKQQIISSWQSNNIGDDLNSQHFPLEYSGNDLPGLKNRKPELLGILPVSKPQIDDKRLLDNHANLLSYNHLIKLKNGSELKINSSYYHDIIEEYGQVNNSYFLNDDTIRLFENTQNKFFNKSLNSDFTFIRNDKKRFLTNKFSINNYRDSETGLINNGNELHEKAQTPHFSFSNDLDVIFPVQTNFVRLYSFFDFNSSPQRLNITPGVFKNEMNNGEPYQITNQNYTEKNVVTQHFLQFTLIHNQWKFETESGINFENQHLETILKKNTELVLADSFRNNLIWNHANFYLSETLKFEKENLRLTIELPFNYHFIQMNDKVHDVPDKIQKWLFTPAFQFRYNTNGYWVWRTGFSFNSKLAEAGTLAQGYILSSYRQLKRGSDHLAGSNGFRYNFGIDYKNPVSGLFYNLMWVSNINKHTGIPKQQLNNNGLLFFELAEKNNRSKIENFTFSIHQYLAKWRATINFKTFYNQHKKEYFLNGETGQLNFNILTLHPGISVNRWKKINFDYNYQVQLFKQKSDQAEISITKKKHEGSLFLTPEKRHLIGVTYEFYLASQNKHNNHVFFADLSYNLKPLKGNLKYKFEIRNIFNHSESIQYYYSDISLTTTSYSIRPRQFMVTVSMGL